MAKEQSSKPDSTTSSHSNSYHHDNTPHGEKVQFVHQANPGPVILENFEVPQEGTEEERMAKAAAMNK
jgi:hypothetical protein